MAVTLVGEIIDSADAATNYTNGNISGDDDFVEGTGAVGLKISNTTSDLVQTSLGGASAPYDFSVGGTEEGWHIVMWFNTKTPVNSTSGLRIRVGNGTNTGDWYVIGTGFYKGGFVTRVVDTAADFDVVSGWSLTGNPAQLTAVSQWGAVFTTTTAIMGSFNNCQVDQFTAGLGLRVDAGTGGTPNTFETVRAADEDTAFYGWWSSSNGAIIGKGKLYIGPATGTTSSVFDDSAVSVVFADERVATGFYEFNMRGANTECTWELMSIAKAGAARWSITLDSAMGSTTGGFSDTNSTFIGSDAVVLNQYATLTGTVLIDGSSMTQNGATLSGVTVTAPNTTTNNAYLTVDDLSKVTGCSFNLGAGAGHAVDLGTISSTTSITWDNELSGYDTGTTGSPVTTTTTGSEAILVNVAASQTLTINVASGASIPSVRNTGTGSVNVVAGQVTLTITVRDVTDSSVISGARVYVTAAAGGSLTEGTVIIDKVLTNGSGQVSDTRSYSGDQPITGTVRKASASTFYKSAPVAGTVSSASGLNLTVQMIPDE